VKDFDGYSASDPRPVLLVDSRRTILAFNAAGRLNLRGLSKGADLASASAEAPDVVGQFVRRCSSTRGPILAALRFYTPDGQDIAWRCDGGLAEPASADVPASIIIRLWARTDAHAGFLGLKGRITALNRELHQRRVLQKRLEEALHAKEILLSEVNHRVKNNLQVIIAMLGLAASENAGPAAFHQTADRIRAMGKVHEMLFESDDFREVECPLLLEALTKSLEAIHRRPDVAILVDCDAVRLSADRATSVALLVNELASNAFKHAFPPGRKGSIRVRLSQNEGMIVLSVMDDGLPMPVSPVPGTGMKIARALAQKLGGELQTTREPIKGIGVAFPAG
jgi:two-component sensor histidine kinase